jgi:hypothetical protein
MVSELTEWKGFVSSKNTRPMIQAAINAQQTSNSHETNSINSKGIYITICHFDFVVSPVCELCSSTKSKNSNQEIQQLMILETNCSNRFLCPSLEERCSMTLSLATVLQVSMSGMLQILTFGIEKPISAKIFWHLLPLEHQCCNISLQLKHNVSVVVFGPAVNLI